MNKEQAEQSIDMLGRILDALEGVNEKLEEVSTREQLLEEKLEGVSTQLSQLEGAIADKLYELDQHFESVTQDLGQLEQNISDLDLDVIVEDHANYILVKLDSVAECFDLRLDDLGGHFNRTADTLDLIDKRLSCIEYTASGSLPVDARQTVTAPAATQKRATGQERKPTAKAA